MYRNEPKELKGPSAGSPVEFAHTGKTQWNIVKSGETLTTTVNSVTSLRPCMMLGESAWTAMRDLQKVSRRATSPSSIHVDMFWDKHHRSLCQHLFVSSKAPETPSASSTALIPSVLQFMCSTALRSEVPTKAMGSSDFLSPVIRWMLRHLNCSRLKAPQNGTYRSYSTIIINNIQ